MQLRMSRRSMAGLTLFAGFASATGWQAQAQTGPTALEIAGGVPVEIGEVMAGGSWTDAGRIGVYRTIVVLTGPNDAPRADVVVQWIGMKAEGGPAEVVKAVAIKQVADAGLSNAQVALEAEREDEITILVTSYDADAKLTAIAFKAGKPGDIAPTSLPPSAVGQQGTKP